MSADHDLQMQISETYFNYYSTQGFLFSVVISLHFRSFFILGGITVLLVVEALYPTSKTVSAIWPKCMGVNSLIWLSVLKADGSFKCVCIIELYVMSDQSEQKYSQRNFVSVAPGVDAQSVTFSHAGSFLLFLMPPALS
jgi:hypothetical protein